MAAAWFKGVRRRICLDYNDTVNKLFHKCFTNSAALSTGATTVTCAPEPITAELKPTTTSRFIPAAVRAGPGFCRRFGPVLFCASKLTVVD